MSWAYSLLQHQPDFSETIACATLPQSFHIPDYISEGFLTLPQLAPMFHSLHIQRFRGLQELTMQGLGRINLLVGTNNCGKSSILEAIGLLVARGTIKSVIDAAVRRAGSLITDDETSEFIEVPISQMFYGYRYEFGSSFAINATSESGHETLALRIAKSSESAQPRSQSGSSEPSLDEERGLEVAWSGDSRDTSRSFVPISVRGLEIRKRSRYGYEDLFDSIPLQFIETAALSGENVAKLFDSMVLTPREDLLIEALQTIDKDIERIASIGDVGRRTGESRRGSFVVKLKGISQRIPIESMGDGVWRMLGIALALVNAENGVLLIDEIDTGLHYKVLSQMWRLVRRTAEQLNVQVFATTHSRDCYESLAEISREDVSEGSEVTIHRIERDLDRSIVFSAQEIITAAELGVEIR